MASFEAQERALCPLAPLAMLTSCQSSPKSITQKPTMIDTNQSRPTTNAASQSVFIEAEALAQIKFQCLEKS